MPECGAIESSARSQNYSLELPRGRAHGFQRAGVHEGLERVGLPSKRERARSGQDSEGRDCTQRAKLQNLQARKPFRRAAQTDISVLRG